MWLTRRLLNIRHVIWMSVLIVGLISLHNLICFPDNCRFTRPRLHASVGLFVVTPGHSSEILTLVRNGTTRSIRTTEYAPRLSWRLVKSVDCARIVNGDKAFSNSTRRMSSPFAKTLSELGNINVASECREFKARVMLDYTVTQEERDFPIAYSILVYKDIPELLHLLRAIYRDHNHYCIHVDVKSPQKFREEVESIASCLKNVLLAPNPVSIVYAGFSRLDADLRCMTELVARKQKWEYLINLSSQMFPLKTNRELVSILKIYNGSNDIEGITDRSRMLPSRFTYMHEEKPGSRIATKTMKKQPKVPHNISVVKGSAYGTFSRKFIEFVLSDRNVQDFLTWCKTIKSPDEYFWATVHHSSILRPPGGYFGIPQEKPWLSTYVSWAPRGPCYSKYVRTVCIFGVLEISMLTKQMHLFANKFYMDHQPIGLDCLEEWLFNRTFAETDLNYDFYRVLPFTNNG